MTYRHRAPVKTAVDLTGVVAPAIGAAALPWFSTEEERKNKTPFSKTWKKKLLKSLAYGTAVGGGMYGLKKLMFSDKRIPVLSDPAEDARKVLEDVMSERRRKISEGVRNKLSSYLDKRKMPHDNASSSAKKLWELARRANNGARNFSEDTFKKNRSFLEGIARKVREG